VPYAVFGLKPLQPLKLLLLFPKTPVFGYQGLNKTTQIQFLILFNTPDCFSSICLSSFAPLKIVLTP
jgi:hypothetical protein